MVCSKEGLMHYGRACEKQEKGGGCLEETEALVGRLPPGGHPELDCPKQSVT